MQQEHEAAKPREDVRPEAPAGAEARAPAGEAEPGERRDRLTAALLILFAVLLAAGAVWWKAKRPWLDPVDPRDADPVHAIGARG